MASQVGLEDLNRFVQDCHLDYAAKGIEISDPLYEWHESHHPDPECLGGTKTVPLLKKDHAVHGVLQSEVYQHPCVSSTGWERQYLTSDLLELWKKWKSVSGQIGIVKRREQLIASGEYVEFQKSAGKRGNEACHSLKNEEGKSLHAVEMAKNSHKEKDEFGRSVNAVNKSNNAFRSGSQVCLTCIETGKTFIYPSIRIACKEKNLPYTSLCRVIYGEKPSLRGYTANLLNQNG